MEPKENSSGDQGLFPWGCSKIPRKARLPETETMQVPPEGNPPPEQPPITAPPAGPYSQPPQAYGQYYRPGITGAYGSADKLEALGKGYFGLNKAFCYYWLCILVIAIIWGVSISQTDSSTGPKPVVAFILLGLIIVLPIALGLLVYPHAKKIGEALGWKPSGPIIAAVLSCFGFSICFGALPFAILQQIAAAEMNRYGVKGGTFGGIRKKQLAEAVSQLRATEALMVSPAAPPPQV
jgi:hypothetical protein